MGGAANLLTPDSRAGPTDTDPVIADADVVWVSAVSGWEVSIKMALGRLRLAEPFRVLLSADDFTPLPVTIEHSEALAALPAHHADPFDRMLVAQARVEGATLVSHDRAFAPYAVPMIWTVVPARREPPAAPSAPADAPPAPARDAGHRDPDLETALDQARRPSAAPTAAPPDANFSLSSAPSGDAAGSLTAGGATSPGRSPP